jgi:hypothetical protein
VEKEPTTTTEVTILGSSFKTRRGYRSAGFSGRGAALQPGLLFLTTMQGKLHASAWLTIMSRDAAGPFLAKKCPA